MAKEESWLPTDEEINKIIDSALREHYKLAFESKRVPSDYLLVFTEGGESNAVAYDVAKFTAKKIAEGQKKILENNNRPGAEVDGINNAIAELLQEIGES